MRKFIVISFIILLLTGCRRADAGDILLTEDISNEASSEVSFESSNENETVSVAQEAASKLIAVYVCGAVKAPGVYYLEEDSRLVDAVDAAGGFGDEADIDYVNLAAPVTDGIRVRIPTTLETTKDIAKNELDSFDYGGEISSDNGAGNGLININTASKEELKTLPGVGDGIAERIIKYRTDNGGFTRIEDIMKISGIKDKLFAKIKESITV